MKRGSDDRVRAIGSAWMGQTTGCAQCHDHKFDPITIRDFYSLGAFFVTLRTDFSDAASLVCWCCPLSQQREHDTLQPFGTNPKQVSGDREKSSKAGQQEWEKSVAEGKFEFLNSQRTQPQQRKTNGSQNRFQICCEENRPSEKPPEKAAIEKYYRSFVQTIFADIIRQKTKVSQRYQQFTDNAPKCLVSRVPPINEQYASCPRRLDGRNRRNRIACHSKLSSTTRGRRARA